MLAGIAAGVFGSADEAIKLCVRPGDVIIPNPANTAEYRRVFGYYRMIHDALEPIYRGR